MPECPLHFLWYSRFFLKGPGGVSYALSVVDVAPLAYISITDNSPFLLVTPFTSQDKLANINAKKKKSN